MRALAQRVSYINKSKTNDARLRSFCVLPVEEDGIMKKIFLSIAALITAFVCLMFAGCSWTGKDDDTKTPLYNLSDEAITYRLNTSAAEKSVYDGTAKYRTFSILCYDERIDTVKAGEEHPDLVTQYFDNVNAGTATIRVTPREGRSKYIGEMTVEFPILPSDEEMFAGDVEELKALLSPANYTSIRLSDDLIVPEGEEIIVAKGTSLFTADNAIVNYGKIVNNGNIYVGDASGVVDCYNYGEIDNNGSMTFYDMASMFNENVFSDFEKGYLTFKGSAGFYSSKDVPNGDNKDKYYRRYSVDELDIALQEGDLYYTGSRLYPSVSVSINGQAIPSSDYSLQYFDNINAGRAKITLSADKYSHSVTGSTELYFDILKASVNVFYASRLKDYLADSNYNEIYYYGGNVSAALEVLEGCTLHVEENVIFTGNLTNNGSIDFGENNFTYSSGVFLNNGSFVENGKIDNSSQIVNNGAFVSGGTFYNRGSVEDNGDMSVAGKFYNDSDGVVTSLDGISNTGTVYIDEDNGVFDGEVVVRRTLEADEYALDNYSFVYDGTAKKAEFVFSGITPAKGSYSYVYNYAGMSEIAYNPVNAGTVEATLVFSIYSEQYKGSYTLSYEIARGSGTFSSVSEIVAALDDSNYDTVVLGADITVDKEFTVSEGYTLVIPAGTDLVNKATIRVQGSILNEGRYVNNGADNKLVVLDLGEFSNNGEAYFNLNVPDGVSGDGAIFTRRDIVDTTSADMPTEVVYGEDNTPDFTLSYGGAQLIKGTDYTVSYSNYQYATPDGMTAKAVCKAAVFSESFFGEKILEYRILGASIEVGTQEEFIAALTSVRSDAAFCNYSEIVFTASITVTNDSYKNVTYTVMPNTTVVLGNYSFNTREQSTGRIFIVNNGVIETNKKNLLLSSVNYSGSGIIVGRLYNAEDALDLSQSCHKIILMADIDKATVSPYFTDGVFDLNGHTVNTLYVVATDRSVRVMSSAEGGTIGGEGLADGGLYLSCGDNTETTVLIEDATIYGLDYGHFTEDRVTIAPTCTIIA